MTQTPPSCSGAASPISCGRKLPKLATFIDDTETDVLAYMSFPKDHRAKIHSTDEVDKQFLAVA